MSVNVLKQLKTRKNDLKEIYPEDWPRLQEWLEFELEKRNLKPIRKLKYAQQVKGLSTNFRLERLEGIDEQKAKEMFERDEKPKVDKTNWPYNKCSYCSYRKICPLSV